VLSGNFDVIVLVETWLHGGISDMWYVVYRNERNVNNSGKGIGGGVLIAVKKFLTSKRLSDFNSSLEDVWISLQCCDNPFVFGAIYLPRDATTVSYAKHVQVVKNSSRNAHLCIQLKISGFFLTYSHYPFS
jgi:hypothetical protein